MHIELSKKTAIIINSFFCGSLFAMGLGIGGLMDPQKVMNFLDITGTWDPSLAFLMVGSLLITGGLFPMVLGGQCPLGEDEFKISKKTAVTPTLVIGSALFGIGWAIGGMCPGPAMANAALGGTGQLIFVGMMLFGLFITNFVKLD